MGNKASNVPETQIPAMAKPLPFNWPVLFPILTRATMPKIIAGIAVRKQVKGARMPSTSEAIANPLVLALWTKPDGDTGVNIELQNQQDFASFGFSVPHFGHRILLPFQLRFA
jgi:hypothetical protein